ncbi:universal stress protein [Cupriavidus pauculus]|uniref:universal stress protein n=1 Tax=Cupriavidus pauculus TaxID=82633 RepID=UPI00078123ED|nr:universal stress protein [Cupriavidus pauculus]
MYTHVLVAVDGSACARQALTEAIGLASACHAHLEIVHIIDYTFLQYENGYGTRADLVPELLDFGKNLLRDAAGVAEKEGVRYTTNLVDNVMSMGDVAGQLLEHVTKSGADVVVVGTHGRHGLKRVFLGSVAESLARACRVPVLLVRERASEAPTCQLEADAKARP